MLQMKKWKINKGLFVLPGLISPHIVIFFQTVGKTCEIEKKTVAIAEQLAGQCCCRLFSWQTTHQTADISLKPHDRPV
jgi:hypothetical protein